MPVSNVSDTCAMPLVPIRYGKIQHDFSLTSSHCTKGSFCGVSSLQSVFNRTTGIGLRGWAVLLCLLLFAPLCCWLIIAPNCQLLQWGRFSPASYRPGNRRLSCVACKSLYLCSLPGKCVRSPTSISSVSVLSPSELLLVQPISAPPSKLLRI